MLYKHESTSAVDYGINKTNWTPAQMNATLRDKLGSATATDPNRRQDDDEGGVGVVTKTRSKTKRPDLYRVLLLNDDYTPMEFVVLILESCFRKNREEAVQIMLHVHQSGVGECGVFPYEVAETKVMQVMDLARKNEHPLQCIMEKK